ncbi:VOC family protein [Altericroceibacterium endophyticum]|uniref:VOC family protein n=1 Tax=Altericroceibacterium endophyticum TaxID=1808508 RepID=A0A6I4T2A2_9SPHN|nr:VOC family protein [Altericroceibacterium endophyticum]MXO65008.1 VOC family protein [Altericroceibacterium endophyticum]
MANSLIFVDLPSDDPSAAGKFYAEVLGWENDPRPEGVFHRMVPGGFFKNKDGSDSQIGNLHLGINDAANMRPHPDPAPQAPFKLATDGRKPRVWILLDDDEKPEDVLKRAEDRGATILWRKHYWAEFNGLNHAFADPWGNEIILWEKGGDSPDVPADYTRE